MRGLSDRQDIHKKIVTEHLTYISSSLEKFNFLFNRDFDFYYSQRHFPYISISIGFSLNIDNLLAANSNRPLNTPAFTTEMTHLYEKFKDVKKQNTIIENLCILKKYKISISEDYLI
jgi:hypothetical protein